MVSPTIIPNVTQAGYTNRQIINTPQSWTSDAAKQLGGILYALFNATGGQLEFIQQLLEYGFDASRIATATDTELDLVAQDFFGNTLYRYPGETDTAFRARIIANLFPPALTQQAISNAIFNLTGQYPRMSQAWNIYQTGAYNYTSYYNIDIEEAPARYGNANYAYQGFITADLPIAGGSTNVPVIGYNAGAFYNNINSYYLTIPVNFLVGPAILDALINRLKAAGTVMWRQYVTGQLVLPSPISGSFTLAAGHSSYTLPNGYSSESPYALVAQPSWNTSIGCIAAGASNFNLDFSIPPSSAGLVDYLIAATVEPGGFIAPLAPGSTNLTITIPAGFYDHVLFVSPSWPTTVWQSAETGGNPGDTQTISFGTPAPSGAILNYIYTDFPVGQNIVYTVPTSAISITIPTTATTPTSTYRLFCLPSWNTTISTTKSSGTAVINFGTPAPSGSFVQTLWSNV